MPAIVETLERLERLLELSQSRSNRYVEFDERVSVLVNEIQRIVRSGDDSPELRLAAGRTWKYFDDRLATLEQEFCKIARDVLELSAVLAGENA